MVDRIFDVDHAQVRSLVGPFSFKLLFSIRQKGLYMSLTYILYCYGRLDTMKNTNGVVFALVVSIIVVSVLFYSVGASNENDTMIVEANVFANSSLGGSNLSIVSVQVPDYLFFGNLTKGQKSDEFQVYINNTGNVDINVKPQLTNATEDIFSYLFFRRFKTSNGTAVPFTRIGNFSLNITKPASGDTYNDEYFYVTLDLTNYTKQINKDMVGHKANVKFIAVARY